MFKLGVLASLGLAEVACQRVKLRPGTGGLRVNVSGLPRGASAEVWIAPRYSSELPFRPRRVTVRGGVRSATAFFVDLPPDGYRVAVNDAQNRGGYFGTWGGQDFVLVRAGQVASERVSVRAGFGAHGHVLDAVTRAPLADVYIAPTARTASDRWPVALPWHWTASDPGGAFVLGGVPGLRDSRRNEPVAIWFQHAGYVERSIPLADGSGAADPATGEWTVLLQPMVTAPGVPTPP